MACEAITDKPCNNPIANKYTIDGPLGRVTATLCKAHKAKLQDEHFTWRILRTK